MKSLRFAIALLCAISLADLVRAQAPTGGIDVVDVVTASATVEKVDLENRKVTLRLEDGKSKTFKAHKSIQNLDQVKVGDTLKLAYTEELIMVIGKTGETPGAAGGAVVRVAPKGAKPGSVEVETVTMSGKVISVDAKNHKVVLQEPDGKKKTVKVSKKVTSLDQLKAGDSIDIAITEALAVEFVK